MTRKGGKGLIEKHFWPHTVKCLTRRSQQIDPARSNVWPNAVNRLTPHGQKFDQTREIQGKCKRLISSEQTNSPYSQCLSQFMANVDRVHLQTAEDPSHQFPIQALEPSAKSKVPLPPLLYGIEEVRFPRSKCNVEFAFSLIKKTRNVNKLRFKKNPTKLFHHSCIQSPFVFYFCK